MPSESTQLQWNLFLFRRLTQLFKQEEQQQERDFKFHKSRASRFLGEITQHQLDCFVMLLLLLFLLLAAPLSGFRA